MAEIKAPAAYLTDAAHLLRLAAPEISNHLMGVRNGFLSQFGVCAQDVQRQEVCGACGHIVLPGDTLKIRLESSRASWPHRKQKARKQRHDSQGPEKIVTCGRCNRFSKVSQALPPKIQRHREGSRVATAKDKMTTTENNAQKPTANASSKKRAKSRKAGLQTLLSEQRRHSTPTLRLGDFMAK